MGLIIPFLGVLAVSIGIAFLFGGEKGAHALGRAVRRGAAGALISTGIFTAATGRLGAGIPLLAIGLWLLKPKILETMKPWIEAGQVRQGRFAGRALQSLSPDELVVLYSEVAGRARDRALLEAYLDRRIPGWREHVESDPAGRSRRTARAGAMTDEQAYQILGLSAGASEAEIRTAYRRLMKRVHPDQGGSTFLAAQINEAKERLLGGHR
ncbi:MULTISPECIES: DnaJ domain-containing protein [Kaistia]|uniref:J domain-containing protein n=1 Tax=Kaistia defluvii TaxID=410841 RepID=A0ABV2QX28_9HYPH|nr:DnaJ domain-containing protein [Kaistia sp.]